MADWNDNINDRQRNSFVEYPAASDKPARRVLVVNETSDPIPVIDSTVTASSPTIFNIAVPTADTEVSQALPVNFNKITIRARDLTRIQFSFIATESSINFITIPSGASYSDDGVFCPSATLYLQTSLDSQVVEVLIWS